VPEIDRPSPLPRELLNGLAAAMAHGEAEPLGSAVLYFPVASSTNDLALRLADGAASDGTLVIAGQQTAGRGRAGHTWFSPPGSGLYMSAILDARKGSAADWVHRLTLATGIAMAEALHAASGLPVMIKWPNDLVMAPAGTVRGARKLAGILAEAHTESGRLADVIVGVGVNVRSAVWPPEISARATSLEEELGRALDAGTVLGAMVGRLATWLRRVRAGQHTAVRTRWQQLAVGATGAPVEVAYPGGVRRGVTCGIDAGGALLVRHGGETERVVGGEVTWL
jgi:BirA family biotin operon repressor/biotin-[acetyl-CoA-carboxylase] ligase